MGMPSIASTLEAEASGFEVSLVYKVSSGIAEAVTQKNPDSKNQQKSIRELGPSLLTRGQESWASSRGRGLGLLVSGGF